MEVVDVSKNMYLATKFYQFCQSHPEMRFWQALAVWSGVSFIYHSDHTASQVGPALKDTFYMEGIRK